MGGTVASERAAQEIFNTPEFQSELKRLFNAHCADALDVALAMANHFDGHCHQTMLIAISMLAMELQDIADDDQNYGLTLKVMVEYAKMAKAKRDFTLADVEGTA